MLLDLSITLKQSRTLFVSFNFILIMKFCKLQMDLTCIIIGDNKELSSFIQPSQNRSMVKLAECISFRLLDVNVMNFTLRNVLFLNYKILYCPKRN